MMTELSEDFVAGWKAAREQYQATGGVQPYPPEYQPEPSGAVEVEASEGVEPEVK